MAATAAMMAMTAAIRVCRRCSECIKSSHCDNPSRQPISAIVAKRDECLACYASTHLTGHDLNQKLPRWKATPDGKRVVPEMQQD